ncbi:hypothetical protein DM01DRAFT_1394127 [Hesseltinella vesiculosa]|uniref:Beta-hexosaminidase n=1 Tax=Hesseltinella vesiculosa TaxID=101127 RepID=A0A1X2GBK9_9FUNG|nr:hypothetical protein DM01DRAFT_1394127 [Hesseltinella vesiculosa]
MWLLVWVLAASISVLAFEQPGINSLPANNPVKQPWIWPLPRKWQRGENTLDCSHMQIQYDHQHGILHRAVQRYKDLFFPQDDYPMVPYNWTTTDAHLSGTLKTLVIQVEQPDHDNLDLDTDESYVLDIPDAPAARAVLAAKTVFGAVRGLETLSQIIQWSPQHQRHLIPNAPWHIQDYPKYPHRGVLFDTARHYYPLQAIKKFIDTMSWNKMNVFHWHMVDSTSFPYVSKAYPELAQKGAYSPRHVYTAKDIQEVVSYAKDRGVRVVPELEQPGHSTAWLGVPEIMSCVDVVPYTGFTVQPPSGQLNIASNKTKHVVKAIVDEWAELFPDSFFHASGDEVVMNCWANDSSIQTYLQDHHMTLQELFSDFVLEIQDHIRQKNKTVIVWQESVLEYNLTMPKDTIIQVWIGAEGVKAATEKGYRTIVSSQDFVYLNLGFGKPRSNPYPDVAGAGFNHWNRVYSYDLRANLTQAQQDLIVGGESALWGELMDPMTFESLAWPRASAYAHNLWSGYEDSDGQPLSSADAILRLIPWRERMVQRGVMASPLNQIWCTRNPLDCFQPAEH